MADLKRLGKDMRSGIYFVGGASGAGKTTVTKKLSQKFDIPVVELDDFQRLIMTAVPVLENRITAMRTISRCVIEQLVGARSRTLVDGAWIEPEEAAELRARYGASFHPVYCGYQDQDLSARLTGLRNKGSHWLSREPGEAAAAFMLKQSRDSERLRAECARWGMSYCDFTSYALGSEALGGDFERWVLSSNRNSA